MRSATLVLLVVLAAAACQKPLGGPELATGDYKLYEAATTSNTETVAVIDSRSHAVERRLPLGAVDQAWTHLYSVSSNRLTDTDPATGATLHTLRLPGTYQLPVAGMSGMPGGLSPNGKYLVLESQDPTSTTPGASHLLVVDTSFNSAPVRIELSGWWEFDAISNDGERVYLIEYLAAGQYRVREYMVAGRYLDPAVIADKSDPQDSMTGLRLSGVPSQDGQFLYSIYVRQNDGPFIHTLPLNGLPVAFCIDLTGPGYQDNVDAMGWALAMSPDGSDVYAVNATLGLADEISTSNQSVTRTVHFTPQASGSASLLITNVEAKELGATAVISPDGKTLVVAGAKGLVWLDSATLQPRAWGLSEWRVSGLASSPDGKLIYAVSDGGMFAELSFNSAGAGTVFDAGALGHPITLMRVAAADTRSR